MCIFGFQSLWIIYSVKTPRRSYILQIILVALESQQRSPNTFSINPSLTKSPESNQIPTLYQHKR